MEKKIKAWQRCECFSKHRTHIGNGKGASPDAKEMRCRRDAVRLVTVRWQLCNPLGEPMVESASNPVPIMRETEIHLCAPCAEHAEGGGK